MQKPYCTVCKWLILIALASASRNNASGATINAADTSFVAVQTAINIALDGDTVILPAGSSTWTKTLTCTKGIKIIGAGIDSTIITSGLPGNAAALVIQVGTKSFTLSGFTFQDTSTSAFGFGIVELSGTTGWR